MTLRSSHTAAALVLLAASAAPQLAQAQRTRGKIEDAEIEIVKERVNQLPEATRNYEKVQIAPPTKTAKPLQYSFPDFRLPSDNLNPSVRVLTIKQEELAPLLGNYVKAGLGNYGTLYGKAYLHNTRDNAASYGVNLSHISSAKGPVDGKNSGVAQSSLGLHGETFSGPLTLGARLDLGRERYNFYGYTPREPRPDADTLKQVFNRAAAKVYLRNRAADAQFQYDLSAGFRYWKDNFEARESDFQLGLQSKYYLTEKTRVAINGEGSFISHKDSVSVSRPFVQVTPALEVDFDRLDVSIGATLGYTGDTIGTAKQFNVYPAVRLGYTVAEDRFVVYGGLGGGLQRVTMYDLTTENPWLGPQQRVADTHRGPTVFFGFSATPARALELNAKVTLANDQNLYFYNNSRRDSTRFDLVYDRKTTQFLNVHGEALYNAAERFRLGFKADYNAYKTKTLAEAFHRPTFQGTFFGSYNFMDKLLVGAELYTLSSSYGAVTRFVPDNSVPPTPSGTYVQTVRPTDSVVDLNLRADYRFSDNLSIFAMGNNLLGRKYERFLLYPVKGVNVLAGVTYQF
ncbi:hypothetical protein FY528_12785 [Hymenobacter lutimineralis]|uniref:Uncharacterized protein n=1 Tax=Hymenobacter lutimineralis TaxID=2606448 RepID=A0A5D6UXQ9_9BACT|nr:TonB-dependent receptor [Hymenobacter lutimineralis]TYZ08323.1 hypothetical protein FY528_12785 [Hymenobacter lutimineralis]